MTKLHRRSIFVIIPISNYFLPCVYSYKRVFVSQSNQICFFHQYSLSELIKFFFPLPPPRICVILMLQQPHTSKMRVGSLSLVHRLTAVLIEQFTFFFSSQYKGLGMDAAAFLHCTLYFLWFLQEILLVMDPCPGSSHWGDYLGCLSSVHVKSKIPPCKRNLW